MRNCSIYVVALVLLTCDASAQVAHESVAVEPVNGGILPIANAKSDDAPWASAFVNLSIDKSGIPGTGSASSLSWLAWGTPLAAPAPGAIAVLDFGKGRGHVGFVEGVYGNAIVLLGGDQNDSVSRVAFSASEITAYRWPLGRPLPSSGTKLPTVKPTEAKESQPIVTQNMSRIMSAASNPGIEVDYLQDDRQTLHIERLNETQIRFKISLQRECSRSVAGIGHAVYKGDPQIETDAGIGYPADEYLFWSDEQGEAGISVRLSIFQPDRARVKEWGYHGNCPLSGAVMRRSGS